jgi:hypothetical protein
LDGTVHFIDSFSEVAIETLRAAKRQGLFYFRLPEPEMDVSLQLIRKWSYFFADAHFFSGNDEKPAHFH